MAQWTIREQLILGSAVQRSGDQNWVSVSRTIRPLSEENRQADFYSQKNCALHYAALLDSASTPKRKKKRGSESETGETTQDLIVRELTEKRLTEINQLLDTISNEYHEVKNGLELIEKGQLNDDEITNMWNKVKDIDYNEITISQKDDHKEENVRLEQNDDQIISGSDKGQPEAVPSDSSDKPVGAYKPAITSDASKANNMATPLIVTPIITPVGNSATLIKIEPNVAMETLGGAKPVQVKVLSHDDHTYSSPGPATLLTTNANATEAMEDQNTSQMAAADQTSLIVDQGTTSNDKSAATTSDQAASYDDQTIPLADQITSNIDHSGFTTDHSTLIVDQPTSSIDQPTSSIDQPTSSVEQSTPNVGQPTPSVDQPTPTVDQPTLTVDQVPSGVDQVAVNVDEDTGEDTVEGKPIVDQITAATTTQSTDQDTNTDNATDQSINEGSDTKDSKHVMISVDQATPMDIQTASTADQSVDDHVDQTSKDDLSVTSKATFVDQAETDQIKVATVDSVNKNITPTATVQASLSVDQIPPTIDHATPVANQVTAPSHDQSISVSDQTVLTVEKKTRTRGSNRIASKMKMAQVGKAKTVRATSPRTMVIIGKQQPTVESDNEEIQVHYKEPTRRLHRLMSNEPSESEEEPLSAITSGVTSPSSSMIDEIDPEVAQSMKLWRKSIMLVWQHASQHKFASLFLHAVKDDEAAGYSEVVFRPMDLSLIKKKIETGVIRSDIEFQRDMLLMFQNALMYNSSNHDVYMMADEMRKDVMENIQDYLATQLMVHTNSRTKILRSRDSRRVEQEEEIISLRKTRHRLPSDESIASSSGAPLAKKMRTRTTNDD